jgi:Ca2+-binding RTX toxin-like protein
MWESQLIRSEALPGRGKGFCLILGTIVVLALTLAPGAFGATAGVDNVSGELRYVAAPGETNNVTITCDPQPCSDTSSYTITDTGTPSTGDTIAITANPPCSPGPTPNQAICPASGVTRITVNAGDLNDAVLLETSVTVGAVLNGGVGDDRLTGGSGSDTVSYSTSATKVSVDLGAGTASGDGADTLTGIENAEGSSFDDSLTGSAEVNVLRGNDGDDVIISRDAVADQVFCGNGLDRVTADAGDIFPDGDCEQIDNGIPPPNTGSSTGSAPATAQLVVASGRGSRLVASFVLIAGRTLKISRKRVVWIKLNCSGNKDCAGVVKLTTMNRVRVTRKRKRKVRLGSVKFFIPAPRTMKVRLRISKRKYRLIKRLGRVKADITVTDRDRAGRARVGTRSIFVKAR